MMLHEANCTFLSHFGILTLTVIALRVIFGCFGYGEERLSRVAIFVPYMDRIPDMSSA